MLSGLSSLDALLGVGFAGFSPVTPAHALVSRLPWLAPASSPSAPGLPLPYWGGMVFLGRPASWHLWRVLGSDGAVGLVSYGDPFAVDFITSVFDSGAFSPDSFSLPRLAEMKPVLAS